MTRYHRMETREKESLPILRLIYHLIDDTASNRLIRFNETVQDYSSYLRRKVQLS